MTKKENKYQPIDMSNLVEGMIVKNYQAMCKLLNQTTGTGNQKKAQLKTWERYFDYDKDGQKFIIIEIYDEPLPSDDGRSRRDGIYSQYIEVLLMRYLTSGEGHVATLTKRKLYNLLGLAPEAYIRLPCNEELGQITSNHMRYTYNLDVELSDIQHFYHRADLKMNSIVRSALNSMKRKMLIKYMTEYVIVGTDGASYVASDEDIKKILAIEHDVMIDMGASTFSRLVFMHQIEEFYSKVNKRCGELYGWEYYYTRLKIIYLHNEIKNSISKEMQRLKEMTTKDNLLELNDKFIDGLNKQAEKKYEYQQFNALWENEYEYNEELLVVQKHLAEYFMRLNEVEAKMREVDIENGLPEEIYQ